MSENTKDIIDKADGVASELYKDAVRPVVKPLGEIVGFLPRTIRLWLGSWEKWLINGEASIRMTAEAIEDKIKNVPEDKIVEPENYVAIPAIQQLSYCQDNPNLRDLYANLLVSSMNTDTKWKVHPSFVDIIKQLNPDEAKLLSTLKKGMTCPLIDVRLVSPEGFFWVVSANFTAQAYEILDQRDNISMYIDNLARLGIIRISNDHLAQERRYEETISLFEKTHNIPAITSDNWKRNYIKKLFELTEYGVSFVSVVMN